MLPADLFHSFGMDVQEKSDIYARGHFIDSGGIRLYLPAPRGTFGLELLPDVLRLGLANHGKTSLNAIFPSCEEPLHKFS